MTAQHRRWILCGGLASGKSAVRRLLDESGVATIEADAIGHQVLRSDGPAFDEVAARWPQVVSNGEIVRRALAGIVFLDPEQLEVLQSITHPHIFDAIEQQASQIDGAVVVEMPLLGEKLGETWQRIVVDARDEVRLERAIGRGMAESDARHRMKAQPARQTWLAHADLVVPNHRSIAELLSTAEQLLPIL